MNKKWFVVILAIVMTILVASFAPLANVRESAAPQEEPVLELTTNTSEINGIVAEAKLWPKDDASLGFASGGVISTVNIEAGDQVKKGDILAELKGTDEYRLLYSQAEVELAEAQDELKALTDAHPSDKAAAERRWIEAKTLLDEANEAYEEFDSSEYRKKIDDANKLAKDKWKDVEDAQELVDDVQELAENSARRIQIEDDYTDVKQDYDELDRKYQTLVNDKDQAAADIQKAQAEVDDAKREMDELADGPKQSKLDIVNNKINAAEQKKSSANSQIELMQIVAPFDGEAVKVDIVAGELVNTGETVIVILDPSAKIVKTVDLSESDVSEIVIGNRVTVEFDAYPDTKVMGTVTKITNWADEYLGDVVYPVEVTLDNTNLPVLWGMTASVQF